MELDTLTERDLLDYKRRLGKNCPTPMDAMRFGQLSMTLEKFLKQADLQAYREAILNKDWPTVDKYEKKILKRTDKVGHVDRRSDVKLPFGTRVRMKSDGKSGVLAENKEWKIVSGHEEPKFNVQIIGGDFHEDVGRTEFEVLCANASCDNEATKRCTRCLTVWYCSRECQRNEWRAHKKICVPFDEVHGAKAKVGILPPMYL